MRCGGEDGADASKTSEQKLVVDMKAMFDERMAALEHKMQSQLDSMKERVSHVDELEKRCKCLEAECNSLSRSMQVLIKSWEYVEPKAKVPPNDVNPNNVNTVDKFCGDIDNALSELKAGKFSHLFLGGQSFMAHHDSDIHYWKKLAHAFQLCGPFVKKGEYGTPSFSIKDIQLTPKVHDILSEGLNGCIGLRTIELDNHNDIEEPNYQRGIRFAVKLIESNQNLESFIWVNNPFKRIEDAASIFDSICSHPSMTYVNLTDCCVVDDEGINVDGYEILCSLLERENRLTQINMNRNGIRTSGDTRLSGYIATNPLLQSLDLSHNHLNDGDALSIAQALGQNTNLTNIELDNNNITLVGGHALMKAVYDPTTLNSVVDSNHSCYLGGDFVYSYSEDTTNDSDPITNKQKISI